MSSDQNSTSNAPERRSNPREVHVTETGMRVVGREAISLVHSAAESALLPSPRDEDVLYAARFEIRPRMGGGSAVHAALGAIGDAVARVHHDAPALTRDGAVSVAPRRFHGLRWETAGDVDVWKGELVWRHPHPVVGGAPCTTQVILAEQHRHSTLAVRVTADGGLPSVRGYVGAGQARPPFLTEMNRSLRLVFDGGGVEARELSEHDVERFVREQLLSESREYPIAVLAPHEDGSYAVPPAELAEELLGLAHLYVIDRHPTTFRLTDTLGDKRLSCYWGALRVYKPGFSCAERPEDHPLLMRERVVDPVMRAELAGKLGSHAGRRIKILPGVATGRAAREPGGDGAVTGGVGPAVDAAARLAPAPVAPGPAPMGEAADAGAASLLSGIASLLTGLGAQIGELARTVAELVDANRALGDEIGRLRTTTAVRTASTTSLERRIGSMELLLGRFVAPEEQSESIADETAPRLPVDAADDEDDTEALSLVDVLRQAATSHPEELLILDSAERSAADSPYEDVDRVAVVLDAMAAIARRRQEGKLGTSLRAAFRELGIDYRGGISPSTSEKHLRQYVVHAPDGRSFECREHIVLGRDYDPRHCLRVYFTSRAPVEPRFVIAHVGRHFDVATTT